ncbi:MAG TPA: GPMC system MBL fold metallohydrolase [Geobacteraceae bacterium]|nr:GPMC system MBL fold metallohydrolase [Geobacteraceae bacterium]
MKFTILGSGTSTGVPMVGCRCSVCSSGDPRDNRTRASLLVAQNGKYILVDTSTDLRTQAIRESIPRIDAVLFTHAHADHIHGIDDLRGFHFIDKKIIPCFASKETLAEIDSKFSYIFSGRSNYGYHQLLEPHAIDGPFELFGVKVTPIPLMHGSMQATGFRFGNFAYLTDCSTIPDSSMNLLKGLDILVIDALRHTPHPHHFNIEGAIGISGVIAAKKTFFTHLTHEIPHSEESTLPDTIFFAYDGLTFEL